MIDGIHTLNILTEVAEERHRQDETWGRQDFPFHHPYDGDGEDLTDWSYGDWAEHLKSECDMRRAVAQQGGDDRRSGLLVLLEEVAEAAAETDPRLIRAELLQVAAVAVKLIEALDRAEAKKHGPGCELGPWHGGKCRPSALLRAARMAVPPVPATFSRITKEAVEHTIKELMAKPYRPNGVYSTGIFDDAGPVPPLKPVTPEEIDRNYAKDLLEDAPSTVHRHIFDRLHGFCRCGERPPDGADPYDAVGGDMDALLAARTALGRAPVCGREAATARPCPDHWPVPPVVSLRHVYSGGDRLHGICRCGNGPDDQIHRCPDCEHGFHTALCRELTGTGAPGDVDECGCSGGS